MIWLLIPVVAVALVVLVLYRPRSEFEEALRRERAMKVLSKRYNPSDDVVLKRRGRGTTTAD